jgi:hypothetical protein
MHAGDGQSVELDGDRRWVVDVDEELEDSEGPGTYGEGGEFQGVEMMLMDGVEKREAVCSLSSSWRFLWSSFGRSRGRWEPEESGFGGGCRLRERRFWG